MWIGRASKTLPSGFDSYTSRYEFFTVLLVGGGIFTRTGVGIGWLAIKGRYPTASSDIDQWPHHAVEPFPGRAT